MISPKELCHQLMQSARDTRQLAEKEKPASAFENPAAWNRCAQLNNAANHIERAIQAIRDVENLKKESA